MTNRKVIILGIGLCCLYIISPVDFLPEIAVGPFGLIDDAAVLAFMVSLIRKLKVLRDDEGKGKEMKQAVIEIDDSFGKK